ncbi:MAG: glycosyltransferase [Armatimonadetes bacterium]|nr:glycosyltransferase [Armatimonadota bacterium]
MLVSICMVTYNHEKYLAQAIESVLSQQVDFDYELVIGEDCSTDRTREVVLEYANRYPDKISPLLHDKNLGMQRNYLHTLHACRGAYIALLEGDDYWTDSHKLQRQVEFLKANPGFSACFTRTSVFHDGDSSPAFCIPSDDPDRKVITTEDLLRKNCIATCSMVFRNLMPEIHFEAFLSLKMVDWPLWVMVSQHGPIGYFNDMMAAYRLHTEGVWSKEDEVAKLDAIVQACRVLKECLPRQYSRLITQKTVKTYQQITLELLRQGNKRASRFYTVKSIAFIPIREVFGFRGYLKRSVVLWLGSLVLPLPWVEKHFV